VIVAAGASISALFADMSYYLQYMGFNRTVLSFTLVAAASMVALGLFLGKNYGPPGVAAAYALPVFFLFISLRFFVIAHFRRL